MNKFLKKLFIISTAALILGGVFWFCGTVFAQNDLGLAQVGEGLGQQAVDIRLVVARIIRTAIGFLGIVAVILVLYGGFMWMTAGGNEEKVGKAKKILINAVIGLAIILSSYAIANFVINRLAEATEMPTGQEGGGGGGNPYFPSAVFFVDSLPEGGQLCVRNIRLSLTFNQNVDLNTLQGNVTVAKQSDNVNAAGHWEWAGDKHNIAMFVPEGSCGAGDNGNDCLEANTAFTLKFVNSSAIKTADGLMSLNCSIRAGCGDVNFISGDGIDRQPPDIIIRPISNDLLILDSTVPVRVSWTDDNGLQKVSLSADGFFVHSQSISGCQKTGEAVIDWPTSGLSAGAHNLEAIGYDWAMQSDTASLGVILRPTHCFNNTLELGEIEIGPPACGGECGVCGGGSCVNNEECASGYCEIPQSGGSGICVDKMKITDITPVSGAVGTYVSVTGFYFGDVAGHIYFSRVANPTSGNANEWVEAQLADCGSSINSWNPWQIVARVPQGAMNGPVKVITGSIVGKDGVSRQFIDLSNDGWGPILNNFQVNDEIRPGLCGAIPDSGFPGSEITLVGANLGLLDNIADQVIFGQLKAVTSLWSENLIKTKAPYLEAGAVGVKVSNGGIESNSVRFFVKAGAVGTAPLIESVTPDHGAKGDYITIAGKNFGNLRGQVWFKLNGTGNALNGNFDFPAECDTVVWGDNQIIVKFPFSYTEVIQNGKYSVQVVTPKDEASQIGTYFTLESGMAAPGICKISPASGPIPFAEGQKMEIVGELFRYAPEVYFWKTGASLTTISGRVKADSGTFTLKTGVMTTNILTLSPPVGAQTGQVVVNRPGDKMSNPLNFTVYNCVENKNVCTVPNTHCCSSGPDSGMCKPEGDLCDGETRSSGYIWRFCTKEIPAVPRVVERCDDKSDTGENIPSPSPSVSWDANSSGDHHKVCRSASVSVEFNLSGINNIAQNQILVNECVSSTVKAEKSVCGEKTNVPIIDEEESAGFFNPTPGTEDADALLLHPDNSYNGGKWKDDTWYQVVLKTGVNRGNGETISFLAKDRPCDDYEDSAYCFVFKTGHEDCKMKGIGIIPYKYTTKFLEEPMKQHLNGSETEDLFYSGYGLSEQHCIIMDVRGFDWNWTSANALYADIFGGRKVTKAQVSSLGNTVGVGLDDPGDAVNIIATASTSSLNYTGKSPLKIDLSNPEVIDFWPNCLQACLNAEVGAKFNTSMSIRNLNSGSVQLLRCDDENCLETTPVGDSGDIYFDNVTSPPNVILKIANSRAESEFLLPNTLYKVILSASTTNLGDERLLWAAARSNDLSSYAKPYAHEFSWRFRTKGEKCEFNNLQITPSKYSAKTTTDKKVFEVQPYSSPDACEAEGQKLNPWGSNWNWLAYAPNNPPYYQNIDALTTESQNNVLQVRKFSTKGESPYCTKNCVRKGSVVSFVGEKISLCGNGLLEAGEDCDPPNKNAGCGLSCLYIGNTSTSTCGNGLLEHEFGEECDTADANTKIGCGANCLHVGSEKTTGATDANASICGNGQVGKGEDCDIGITGNVINSKSSLNCTEKCLHAGARLSGLWCYNSRLNYANFGFTKKDYETACANSASICGNKISEPEEDPECDTQSGVNQNCNDYCLLNTGDNASDNSTGNNCAANSSLEGCSGEKHQHIGSSLNYSSPSSCGDGEVGLGEDAFCEGNGLTRNREFWNPWALAIGVGEGEPDMSRVPPAQWAQVRVESAEKSAVTGKVFSGAGEFIIYCGYQSDDECRRFGDNYGLGKNTCCYPKPVLTSTIPENNSRDVCPNTYLEARFDKEIDKNTLAGNVLLAKGVDTGSCGEGFSDVTRLVFEENKKSDIIFPWYKKIFVRVGEFLSRIFGREASAADITATAWCAVNDYGSADVIPIPDTSPTSTRVIIKLKEPLAINSKYAIVLQEGVKDTKGVSIGKALSGKKINWKLTTRGSICEINSLSVVPDKHYFSHAGGSITLDAQAKTAGGEIIQPIMGYYGWQIIWGPKNNDLVTLTDTASPQNQITAQNRNGEIDIIASANIKAEDNKYTPARGIVATGVSRITIFLCENPWPPKDLYLSGAGPYAIFPFTDEEGNNDGTDASGKFNNTALASSDFGGYFNFKTYYCADSGGYGILDDLPFMRVTAQTNAKLLEKTGVCQKTGASCNASLPCQSVCVYRGGANDGKAVLNSNGDFITCSIGGDCGLGADCFAVTCDNPEKVLKRFLFTSETNRDVIGIQIFPNTSRLSLREWFNNSKEQGGQGFTGQMQDVKINGYDALTDGSNIYLDALNYTSDKKLYTNIYLFSVNADAKQETKKVFEQIMQNLKLNSNLSNYGYCGINADTISEPYTSCENDLDCPGGQICSAKVNKLKRNYERLCDLKTIENNLNGYFEKNANFPDLKEGTYLAGQTLSAWPSWSVLGSAVGYNLPTDPINELGKSGTCSKSTNIFCVGETCPSGETCVLHDPATGWSVVDRRFSYACNSNSYAYRYLYKENSKNYEVRAKFEEPFLNPLASGGVAGWIDFVKSFVDIANFKTNDSSGICVLSGGAFEVSSYNQGVCGDKIINVGSEECDPVGSVTVDASQCSVSGGSAQKKTCATGCVWGAPQSILCSQLSKCGNNIVESGEKCDDGALNGKYNHCNLICSGKVPSFDASCGTNPKLCLEEISPGFCGDAKINDKYEICDIKENIAIKVCAGGTKKGETCNVNEDCPSIIRGSYFNCENIRQLSSQERYAPKKENSCGWDCQSYGPYCGDGAVQAEYEECEDNVVCTTSDNKNGFKECNKLTCQFKTGGCVVPTIVPITSATPACGDGVVGSDEACDNGATNNGKACVAGYGKTCSYCSSDCKNTITVQSKEYCGDGIINGDEVCDTTSDTDTIWARTAEDACGDDAIVVADGLCSLQPNPITHGYEVPLCSEEKTDPYSFKKGTKQCLNNCKTLQSNCVICGLDDVNGVGVAGNIMNVLENTVTPASDPLLALGGSASISLFYASPFNDLITKVGYRKYDVKSNINYSLKKSDTSGTAWATSVKISSNPICFNDTEPNYKLVINGDIARAFSFSVFASPEQGDYDLILSPVITKNITGKEICGVPGALGCSQIRDSSRPNDIRVVVSWKGEMDFKAGFAVPELVEESSFSAATSVVTKSVNYFTYPQNTLIAIEPVGDMAKNDEVGIWCHGSGQTAAKTKEIAFTLDTTKLRSDNYVLYVRATSSGIKNYTNTAKLKVEVYFPENDTDARHFARPAQTYYLNAAISSDNSSAMYWQVLNVKKSTIESDVLRRVAPINKIKTGAAYFEF